MGENKEIDRVLNMVHGGPEAIAPRPRARPSASDVKLQNGVFLYRMGRIKSSTQFMRPCDIFKPSHEHLEETNAFFAESNILHVVNNAMNFGFGQGMQTGFNRGKEMGYRDGHAEGAAKYMNLNECLKEHKTDEAPCKHPGCIQYFFKYQADKILLRHTERRLRAALEQIQKLEANARAMSVLELEHWTDQSAGVALEESKTPPPSPAPTIAPSSTPVSGPVFELESLESILNPVFGPVAKSVPESPPPPAIASKRRLNTSEAPSPSKKLKVEQ